MESGDLMGRDKVDQSIKVDDMRGTGIAIGHNAQATEESAESKVEIEAKKLKK